MKQKAWTINGGVTGVVPSDRLQHSASLIDGGRHAHRDGSSRAALTPKGNGDVNPTSNGQEVFIVCGAHHQRGEVVVAGRGCGLNGGVEQVGANVVVKTVNGAGSRTSDRIAAGLTTGGGASTGARKGKGNGYEFNVAAAGFNAEGEGVGITSSRSLADQPAPAHDRFGGGADVVHCNAGANTDGCRGAVGAAVGAGDGRIDSQAEGTGQREGVEVLVCGHREAADRACLHIAHQGAGAIAVGDQVIGVDGNGTRDRQRQALRRFHAKAEGTGAILGPLGAAGDRQLRRGSA